MGRVYGAAVSPSAKKTGNKPADIKFNDKQQENVSNNTKKMMAGKPADVKPGKSAKVSKPPKAKGSGKGGAIVIGVLLGAVLSVGGYVGYSYFTGSSPSNLISTLTSDDDSSFVDTFAEYGIDLHKDFVQYSYTNSEQSAKLDVSQSSIESVSINSDIVANPPSGYKLDQFELNGNTNISISNSSDNISIVLTDGQATAINYQAVNSANSKHGNIVICGVKSTDSLSDILNKLGTPSYISTNDSYVNNTDTVNTSLSLSYNCDNETLTISFSNINGSMEILSISYSNLG